MTPYPFLGCCEPHKLGPALKISSFSGKHLLCFLAGVEFAGTLSDFVRVDLQRKYPELMQDVRVTLLQSAQSILAQFDSR